MANAGFRVREAKDQTLPHLIGEERCELRNGFLHEELRERSSRGPCDGLAEGLEVMKLVVVGEASELSEGVDNARKSQTRPVEVPKSVSIRFGIRGIWFGETRGRGGPTPEATRPDLVTFYSAN